MKLFVAGPSYKTAPVALCEQLVVSPAKLLEAACNYPCSSAWQTPRNDGLNPG